jgi:hypothetical protein
LLPDYAKTLALLRPQPQSFPIENLVFEPVQRVLHDPPSFPEGFISISISTT